MLNRELLYKDCYEAWKHASNGCYPPGSNYWMEMFVDKLIECRTTPEPIKKQIETVIERLEQIKDELQ